MSARCKSRWRLTHATEVGIFGEVYRRRAWVVTIGGLPAHAGQNMLVDYAGNMRRSLKGVYLVHTGAWAGRGLLI